MSAPILTVNAYDNQVNRMYPRVKAYKNCGQGVSAGAGYYDGLAMLRGNVTVALLRRLFAANAVKIHITVNKYLMEIKL